MPSRSWMTTGNREIGPFRTFKDQLDFYFEDWFGRSIGKAGETTTADRQPDQGAAPNSPHQI
jgi:hypothetical protein